MMGDGRDVGGTEEVRNINLDDRIMKAGEAVGEGLKQIARAIVFVGCRLGSDTHPDHRNAGRHFIERGDG